VPTQLTFAKDHRLTVDEDLNAVESAFRRAPSNPAALAQFTRKGERIFVNTALVRSFREIEESQGPVSF